MRALYFRFYAFARLFGLVLVSLGTAWALLLQAAVDEWLWPDVFVWVLIPLLAAMAAVVSGMKYQRSTAVKPYTDFIPLLYSKQEYCLVLRPFGHDGEMVLPAPVRKNRTNSAKRQFLPNTVTMEQIVATAVRRALNLESYGIVDQDVAFAPPGLRLIKMSNKEWKMVATGLIRRAHSIILLLPPGSEIGQGFAWELDLIVRHDLQSRVLLVLPPDRHGDRDREQAIRQANFILTVLEGSGLPPAILHELTDDSTFIPPGNTLVLRSGHRGRDMTRKSLSWWMPAGESQMRARSRPRAIASDSAYISCLVMALAAVEEDFAGLAFDARYPRDQTN